MSATPSTSATNYAGFISGFVGTNDTGVRSLIPLDGKIENFYINLTVAPGSGKSYAFTLQKNGADTAFTCTVSNTSTTCNYIGLLGLSAGDNISIKCVPSGTPASTSARVSTDFISGTGNGAPVLSSSKNVSPSTGSAQSVNIQNGLGWSFSGTRTQIPTSGTLSKLRVLVTNAPGAGGSGKSWGFTINKNSVGTSITCTVSETATTCSDLSNSVSVVQGDFLSVTVTPTGTPTSSTIVIGSVFTPVIDGESFQTFSYGGGVTDNSQVTYADIGLVGQNTSTTETSRFLASSSYVAKKLYFVSGTAPGASKTWQYYLRKNSADTALTCSKTGGSATTCSDNVNIVPISSGDLINFKFSPTNSPSTSTSNHLALVFFSDPQDKIYGGTLYGSTLY